MTIAQRTAVYARRLRRYRQVMNTVAQPTFNASKGASLWHAYTMLGDWLRSEADALWNEGVNVYEL